MKTLASPTPMGAVEGAANGLYVYGFARFRRPGADAVDLGSGLLGAPVGMLRWQNLAALISDVPERLDFTRALDLTTPEGAVTLNLPLLTDAARAHEAVLLRAMSHGTVVPIRFGTVFRSEAAIESWVSAHCNSLVALLERLCDREEWIVEALAHPRIIQESVAGRLSHPCQGEGASYLWRKWLEAATAAEIKAASAQVAEIVPERLLGHASDASLLPCAVATTHHRSAAESEPIRILRIALLREQRGRPGFLAAVRHLNRVWQSGEVRVEACGPLPAYHFSALRDESTEPEAGDALSELHESASHSVASGAR